jgi:hypothetical protein
MKKRQLILNDYRTAEDGLFTLSACKITKAAQEQTFVKVPGRFAPLDLSTVLTDGQPYYGNASLDAVLESSEGTRAERQEHIDHMKNLLDGHIVKIIHPDFPGRYLVGRVEVAPDFNGLAYCSVNLSAVLEPWLYNDTETVKEAILPFAEVTKIGGMTRKCTNLFDPAQLLNASGWTESGGIYSGTLKSYNVAFANGFEMPAFEPNTRYTVSVFGYSTNGASPRICAEYTDGTNGILINISASTMTHYSYVTAEGKSVSKIYGTFGSGSNETMYLKDIQVTKGSTALPYEPYFDGLRSAPVTAVESAGKNFWNNAAAVQCEGTLTKTETGFIFTRGSFTKGTSYSYSIPLTKGQTITFSCTGQPYTPMLYLYKERAYGTNLMSVTSGKLTYTAQEDLPKATFTVIINSTEPSVEVSNIQVELGDSVTSYAPYLRSQLSVPAAVQALEGYGDGINDTCYNYVDWEKKQFVKRVGKVDLGTLDWVVKSDYAYSASIRHKAKPYGAILYSNLPTGIRRNSIDSAGSVVVAFDAGLYTDATAFKSAMSGVMLYYELAEPIITDISDLLTEDALIGVEGGGTTTMANEHGFAVPSEVTFTVDSDTKGVEDFSVAYRKAVPGTAPQGTQEHVLTNEGRLAVVPVVEVVGEVTLKVGNSSRALSTGTYLLPDLYLTPGEHRVLCSGAGMATITYREAVLAG